MAIATEQLEAINQQITQAFSDHSRITVVATDGTPPDKYEITYQLDGLQKSASGAIEKSGSHTISISIPFGFPHFPPSCKPKSPIFHPDFDPAAICIGDFWEKNRSIVDLINHIGEMISGAYYSTSNAFNEEAAQWYAENFAATADETLPGDDDNLMDLSEPALAAGTDDDFTSLLDDDEDDLIQDGLLEPFEADNEDSVEPALSFVEEDDTPGDEKEGDSLADIFQESDFDFEEPARGNGEHDDSILTSSESGAGSDTLSVQMEEDDIDLEHLQELAAQKRFYGLDKELSMLSADVAFEGKEALAEQAAVALEEAQSLYTRALEFEHKGEPENALKCFRRIETYTTDYPALNEDISRMTQALELLGGWTEPTPESKQRSRPKPKPHKGKEKTSTDRPAQETGAARTFFDDQEEQKSRLVPYALGVIVVLIGAAVGVNYYFSSSTYSQAEQRFEQCRASLAANRFSEAELQCESALGLVNQVAIFKSSARDALVMDIEKTLQSKPLTEGLAGNLMLDGAYYPKQVVANITAFREFKNKGDELFAEQHYQESVSNYQQALAIAKDENAIDRQEVLQISENIKIADFRRIYQSGVAQIDNKKLILATKDLNEALELLRTLTIPDKAALIDTITAQLAGIEQATEKEKGDSAFAEDRWSEAATHYRNALALAMQSPRPNEEEIYELKQLVVKGDLYTIIAAGKSAFRQAQWDEAISNYDKAINLLEDNRELLKQANTEENRRKLARIVLQASLIRDKQDAARHLKAHRYDEAITTLNSLISSVSASEFSSEEEFAAVRLEAQQSIDEARENKLLADKISYLEDNFEELFTKHYSGSPPESLVEREVVFERKMGSKLLFRLQCVEVGRGRPLQLVMKYVHDLDSGTWSFYSDSS